ncbi:hypothetical protein BGZ63DRAFT_29665 [Mariannaea sp. PMI_226]|nr:hypothetical protein BGZ63DRAFT_29665 [Mariannaea sp. PMI_226]
MSASPLINNNLRTVGFGLWAGVFGFSALLDFGSHFSVPHTQILLAMIIALTSLSLEAFLFFKIAYYFSATSWRTTKWHTFFYESRKGSMALLLLSFVWFLTVLGLQSTLILDLLTGGTLARGLGWLYFAGGGIGLILGYGIYIFIMFEFVFLAGWVFWTGAKALWRVGAPNDRRDEYEVDF